jgi:hypothetical protein
MFHCDQQRGTSGLYSHHCQLAEYVGGVSRDRVSVPTSLPHSPAQHGALPISFPFKGATPLPSNFHCMYKSSFV